MTCFGENYESLDLIFLRMRYFYKEKEINDRMISLIYFLYKS